jgi:hydroxymethylglutaryl-CoA lyase
MSFILVCEVGPRDGLQAIARTMPTEAKHRWIAALARAGIGEIEVGSFVSPKLLPQMADMNEVVAKALTIGGGLHVVALAPNLKGALNAFESGVEKITLPVSVSEPHSLANVRKTHAQMIDEVRSVIALRDERFPSIKVEAGMSTVFGCTLQGLVPEDDVMRMADVMAQCGVDEIGLADTAGYATPNQVRSVFRRLQAAVGERAGGAHFHNTLGLGLANVVAALDVGVTTFDSSMGGIGGCPYAPGATGNIVTEDLVFLLASMGFSTGIDIARLLEARAILLEGLPGQELYGYLPSVGLPKGFTCAEAGQ